jgi:hypothetical protein
LMNVLRWIVILLALQEAGWMAFDGTRALITGEFVTAKTGPHAGELGVWSKVVSRVGIAPRSTLMKGIFAVYGWTWMLIAVCYAMRIGWARNAMFVAAAGSLWFLPFGTISSGIQLILLSILARAAKGGG